MNKFEKDTLRMLETHARMEKNVLGRNVNKIIRSKGIRLKGKNQWISEVTGYPIGTVETWFSHSKHRILNKISPTALCRLAVELKISVWDFLETEENEHRPDEIKIDRRSSMYWFIRRREAQDIWDSSYAQEKGTWSEQDKAVKREFMDRLYLERLELYERGYQNEKNMEEEQNGKTY